MQLGARPLWVARSGSRRGSHSLWHGPPARGRTSKPLRETHWPCSPRPGPTPGRRAGHLAAFDLTSADFDLLATIRRTQASVGVNPSRLLQSVMVTSGGLTKRLDRLEESGLIDRHPDPGDRRGTLVRLTPAGEKQIDTVLPSVLAMEHEFLTRELSASELEEVATLLRRLGMATNAGPEDSTDQTESP